MAVSGSTTVPAAGRRRSLLGPIFIGATALSPRLKRRMWGWVYDRLARHDRDPSSLLLFMNYGYASDDADGALALRAEDEPYRHEIQLYEHVVDGLDLAGKHVLEVGAGRGGGAAYLARYRRPASVLGVDLSAEAVARCREVHQVPGLRFAQGAAGALAVDAASIDVVVNVESSHCYPDMAAFLAEVYRMLRPGGYLAFCDLRLPGAVATLHRQFAAAGLVTVRTRVINDRVVAGLDGLAPRREALSRSFPIALQGTMRDLFGVRETAVYERLRSGRLVYLSCLLQRPGPRA